MKEKNSQLGLYYVTTNSDEPETQDRYVIAASFADAEEKIYDGNNLIMSIKYIGSTDDGERFFNFHGKGWNQ